MARARSRVSIRERKAGYAILALLALIAVWLLISQAQFNPAVIVAMNHPKGAGRVVTGQQAGAASLSASYLADMQGFAALSPVESYNPETLSDKIDGKAELYLASGFQEMSCRSFAVGDTGQARVEIYLYAMESPKDAFAVFSGQRRSGGEPLPLAANAYATENAFFLTRDRFYIELVADKASPEVRPALETLTQALLSALPQESALSADADLFPAKGLHKDSVRLAVSDALGMEGLENVYTADYSLDPGEAGAFLAVRQTPEEAKAQAEAYVKFLALNGFKEIKPAGAPPGATVMALDTMVQVVMAKGQVLAGVHDAASPKAALELAGEVAKSLEEKEAVTKQVSPETPDTGEEMNRRDFIKRVASASAIAVGACGLGLVLADRAGPPPLPEQKALPGLGDFSLKDLPPGAPRMAVVRGTDRTAMFEQGVRALGGMEAFIKKGDKVLIKVNAAFASPAALGATTHPELLAAVASACTKAGAAQVSVTDNPINNPESCFEITGLAGAARQAGAKIIVPRAALFTPATLPNGRLIKDWPVLAGAFAGVTKVIALAPVKDHARAGASMLLKNMYGLLGGRRNVFHQDINGIITELSLLLRPTLSVLDGTVSMMTNGPTGGSLSDLKATGTLIVTTDPVAADAMGAELLGRTLEDIPYIRLAQAAGAGTADYKSLNPAYLDAGA